MSVEKCNEVTVKIRCDVDEVCKILKSKGFKVIDKFYLDNCYFVKNELDVKDARVREILNQAVIVREVYRSPERIVRALTFKNKEFDSYGDIVSQRKVECNVLDIEEAKEFLRAIGYREIMRILKDDVVYRNGEFILSVKDVKDGVRLIESDICDEMEIEWVKERFEEFEIPVDFDEWFVKKAEIELEKVLKEEV